MFGSQIFQPMRAADSYLQLSTIGSVNDLGCFFFNQKEICMEDLVPLEVILQTKYLPEVISYEQQHLLGAAQRNAAVMPSVADQGCCSACNPYVPYRVAPIVLVFNIFFPGFGTIIAAYYDPKGINCKAVTCGIFQFALTIVLVGWIWSVVQGCAIYNKSRELADENQNYN